MHGDSCNGYIVAGRKVTCLGRAAELATRACCARVQVLCLVDAAVVGMEVSLLARTLLSERMVVVGVALFVARCSHSSALHRPRR